MHMVLLYIFMSPVELCHAVIFAELRVFYKKSSSRPSTKSFLIFGNVLVLKVSYLSELNCNEGVHKP